MKRFLKALAWMGLYLVGLAVALVALLGIVMGLGWVMDKTAPWSLAVAAGIVGFLLSVPVVGLWRAAWRKAGGP